MSSYYSKRNKQKFIARRLGVIFLLVVVATVCFAVIYKIFAHHGKGFVEATTEEGMVTINGRRYRPKTNLKTYLFIGEDENGIKEAKKEYGARGMADVFQLVVFDRDKKTYTRIPINRNTICDVKSLDIEGNYLATTKLQISYAHAKGDGMETSCENTVDAVSNLFYGIDIQEYVSLNMDAIGVLNHLADGVTVTVEDDMTSVDPALSQGITLTLSDDQAEKFVRARMNVSDGTNESRMKRQETYLAALKDNYREKLKADEAFATEVYQSLEKYMVTSLSLGDVSRLAKAFLDSEDRGRKNIQGTVGEDEDGYATFEPDKESIDKIATSIFFEPAE